MSADNTATTKLVLDFVIEADEEEQLPTQKALQELMASQLPDELSDGREALFRVINVGSPPSRRERVREGDRLQALHHVRMLSSLIESMGPT